MGQSDNNYITEEITDFRGFTERFREVYTSEIKPWIEKEYYNAARDSLFDIVTSMGIDKDIFNFKQVFTVHSCLNFLSSIKTLYDSLNEKRGDFIIKRNVSCLDAWLAQTKLPTQEEIKLKKKGMN